MPKNKDLFDLGGREGPEPCQSLIDIDFVSVI